MKRIALVILALSFMTTMAMAEDQKEWKGSLKVGRFQEETSVLKDVKITLVKAIQIAEGQMEGVATKAELDKEDGYVVYTVEFNTPDGEEREIMIDPVTGEILEKDEVD